MLGAEGSEEAIVVDPGFEPAQLRSMLEAVGRRPVAVLLTHAHSDHAEAAGEYEGEDLPGEPLSIEFWARLRDEVKYDSVDELVAAIRDDVDRTQRLVPHPGD